MSKSPSLGTVEGHVGSGSPILRMAEAGFTLMVMARNVCSGIEGPAVG